MDIKCSASKSNLEYKNILPRAYREEERSSPVTGRADRHRRKERTSYFEDRERPNQAANTTNLFLHKRTRVYSVSFCAFPILGCCVYGVPCASLYSYQQTRSPYTSYRHTRLLRLRLLRSSISFSRFGNSSSSRCSRFIRLGRSIPSY